MATVYKRNRRGNHGGRYYIAFFDYSGKRQVRSARTTDKATAERIAAKLQADAALRRDGVIDPALEAVAQEAQRPVADHLADYEAKLRTANRTEKHVTSTLSFIRQIADFAGFGVAADIDADGVARYAGKLQNEGRAARTIQAHLNAMTGFTRWLTQEHKLPRDPLASVKKPNPKSDRRRERRMLLPDEWRRLEAATLAGPEREGMTGRERRLLYRLAVETGLRSAELRSLSRGRLFLDAEPPYVTCKAGSTKNRKDARQYIGSDLAADLGAYVATKAPGARVFDLPHESYLARMLRADLAEARRAWLREAKADPGERTRREQSDFLAPDNHDGETLDFHSLRHTCGAWLAMSGAHPKVVQAVMRHSSIVLTMDTYGHLFPGSEAAAVAGLRDLLAVPVAEALRATGTDDFVASESDGVCSGAQRCAQQLERETLRDTREALRDRDAETAERESPKPFGGTDLGDESPRIAEPCESSGAGTRTPDTRIMIPLL